MSLSSDFSKSMAHKSFSTDNVKAKPGPRKIVIVDEIAVVPKAVWDACEALIWRSACCDSQPSGELSAPWHELKAGGESIVTCEGMCAKCGQKAHFVKA